MGYRLYQRIDGELTEIDATTVDFSAYSKDRFPFIIRQDPGEANALGKLKFVMPNRDDIFMHDTPDRHLFRRPDRAFSSGCIRLERPMDLLAEAFNGMPAWGRERFDRVLESGATQGVALARPRERNTLCSTAFQHAIKSFATPGWHAVEGFRQ